MQSYKVFCNQRYTIVLVIFFAWLRRQPTFLSHAQHVPSCKWKLRYESTLLNLPITVNSTSVLQSYNITDLIVTPNDPTLPLDRRVPADGISPVHGPVLFTISFDGLNKAEEEYYAYPYNGVLTLHCFNEPLWQLDKYAYAIGYPRVILEQQIYTDDLSGPRRIIQLEITPLQFRNLTQNIGDVAWYFPLPLHNVTSSSTIAVEERQPMSGATFQTKFSLVHNMALLPTVLQPTPPKTLIPYLLVREDASDECCTEIIADRTATSSTTNLPLLSALLRLPAANIELFDHQTLYSNLLTPFLFATITIDGDSSTTKSTPPHSPSPFTFLFTRPHHQQYSMGTLTIPENFRLCTGGTPNPQWISQSVTLASGVLLNTAYGVVYLDAAAPNNQWTLASTPSTTGDPSVAVVLSPLCMFKIIIPMADVAFALGQYFYAILSTKRLLYYAPLVANNSTNSPNALTQFKLASYNIADGACSTIQVSDSMCTILDIGKTSANNIVVMLSRSDTNEVCVLTSIDAIRGNFTLIQCIPTKNNLNVNGGTLILKKVSYLGQYPYPYALIGNVLVLIAIPNVSLAPGISPQAQVVYSKTFFQPSLTPASPNAMGAGQFRIAGANAESAARNLGGVMLHVMHSKTVKTTGDAADLDNGEIWLLEPWSADRIQNTKRVYPSAGWQAERLSDMLDSISHRHETSATTSSSSSGSGAEVTNAFSDPSNTYDRQRLMAVNLDADQNIRQLFLEDSSTTSNQWRLTSYRMNINDIIGYNKLSFDDVTATTTIAPPTGVSQPPSTTFCYYPVFLFGSYQQYSRIHKIRVFQPLHKRAPNTAHSPHQVLTAYHAIMHKVLDLALGYDADFNMPTSLDRVQGWFSSTVGSWDMFDFWNQTREPSRIMLRARDYAQISNSPNRIQLRLDLPRILIVDKDTYVFFRILLPNAFDKKNLPVVDVYASFNAFRRIEHERFASYSAEKGIMQYGILLQELGNIGVASPPGVRLVPVPVRLRVRVPGAASDPLATCQTSTVDFTVHIGCEPGQRIVFDWIATRDAYQWFDPAFVPCSTDPDIPCYDVDNDFWPVFQLIDEAAQKAQKFTGSYTLKIVGMANEPDNMTYFSDSDAVIYNTGQNSEEHIVNPYMWTPKLNDDGSLSSKVRWMPDGTPVLTANVSDKINFRCNDLTPCGSLLRAVAPNEPVMRLEFEMSTAKEVNSNNSYCEFATRFQIRLRSISPSYKNSLLPLLYWTLIISVALVVVFVACVFNYEPLRAGLRRFWKNITRESETNKRRVAEEEAQAHRDFLRARMLGLKVDAQGRVINPQNADGRLQSGEQQAAKPLTKRKRMTRQELTAQIMRQRMIRDSSAEEPT